mmetsp:Transcript_47712/g.54948  ORF Transcript_47712/g.54948 Transcript_47712/m.54948 type:complete len:146 (+) Transcript_47712:91-528(+)|eukprot:CAMPEP_0115011404 /NCGR_PEP_ID=MMETSP0216-20121206/23969_1 /TAXON_ID=223996 /ORGANISM="Protocruzia adherens, Strain Boccale" /LENGTH=145 /DNA_ID=CAMNT_0002379959 /DNA_START=63 /DNA_END=500 /DNA_ORIENTATION=-
MARQASTKKAQKTSGALQKGKHTIRKHKVWTTVTFRRPKTLSLARKPLYSHASANTKSKFDQYAIIRHPLTTESAMKMIEDHNTLIFVVDVRANKRQIWNALKDMYDIKAAKVNTLVRPDGQKKAFAKLSKDQDALDIANKIGII